MPFHSFVAQVDGKACRGPQEWNRWISPTRRKKPGISRIHDGRPNRITAVVISSQHDEFVNGEMLSNEQLRSDIKKYVIDEIIPQDMIDNETDFHINPTGKFVIGGPQGDCGLTGRKIIVDTTGVWDVMAAVLVVGSHKGRPKRSVHGEIRGQHRSGRLS